MIIIITKICHQIRSCFHQGKAACLNIVAAAVNSIIIGEQLVSRSRKRYAFIAGIIEIACA